MRFFTRSLWGLFLFAATIGLLTFGAYQIVDAARERAADQPMQRAARERVLAVNVVTFQSERISPVLTAYGEVRATRTLEMRAPVGGQIAALHDDFSEGGAVTSGNIIIQLDPSDAETVVAKARSTLRDTETNLAEAHSNLDLVRAELAAAEDQAALRAQATQRQQNLLDRGVGTEAALETAALAEASAAQSVLSHRRALAQAEIQIERATTALDAARIDLHKAERDLEELTLRAKFDGILTGVNGVVGGFVSSNEKLADLIDPTALEVAFRVSTAQYSRLIGPDGRLAAAPVTVALDVYGFQLEAAATLLREGGAVAEGQSGRVLYAKLRTSSGLRPGDFVTVALTEPPLAGVARLPATALGADETVLVVDEDARLRVTPVTLLRREGDDIIVRAPRLDGRQIVVERTPLLGDGIRIRPLSAEGAAETTQAPDTVTLSDDRRAALVAFVQRNTQMPDAARTRVLKQLEQADVPTNLVDRLEQRMAAGG